MCEFGELSCPCVCLTALRTTHVETVETCLYMSVLPLHGTVCVTLCRVCVCVCVCVWLRVHCIFSGCVPLTLSVWSVCSLMEVARAKCRAPSCCLRHPRWHALCPSPCPTLKSSARPLTADSPHPHLRVSHPQLPLPSTNPITAPVSPQTTHRGQSEPIVSSSR